MIPQPSAYLIIGALPDEMTYPDSTAIWEDRLHSMAQGEGTVDEFIAGQAEVARKLCQKAYDAKMHVDGIACPRCGNGVMQKRHGKNGDFWGCSNYPRCRMTCDGKRITTNAMTKMASPTSKAQGVVLAIRAAMRGASAAICQRRRWRHSCRSTSHH